MAITEYEDQIQEIVNKSDHSEFTIFPEQPLPSYAKA